MKVGDPLDRSTDHGPQNNRAHLEKLVNYCRTGAEQGATLLAGGKRLERPGEILAYSVIALVIGTVE